jgi:hypothetical protein
MSASKNKLARDVAVLSKRRKRLWAEVGSILDQVEREKYWAGQAQSFSEWLKSFALKIGMKEASLWRYLGAIRYYQKVRKHFRGTVPFIPLAKLPERVSAEKLELLEKIERVVPEKLFNELGERVLAGSVTRTELDKIWKTYRRILKGRTKRGRGMTAPRINPADRTQVEMQSEATVLTTLMAAGPEWTGIKDPQFFHTIAEVIPKAGPEKHAFDMVALIRKSEDSPVIVIGVEIKSYFEIVPALNWLAPYCDRLWVVLVGQEKASHPMDLPEFVGILRVDAGKLRVERPASESYPGLGVKTGEMAKELLPRLLQ